MKVTIPESNADITLEQFIKYEQLKKREGVSDLEHNKRAISIFTNLPYQKIGKIKQSDYEVLINDIIKAINTEEPFQHTFKLNGVEYGFIPNLDKMTQAEYMDLSDYQDQPDKLNYLMAVLFRQIKNKDAFGNYSIEHYEGTDERAELFLQMPLNIVIGAIGFFLTLSKHLKKAIQRYTMEELARVAKRANTLKSGDGMLV